jgi:hypothetical protein
MISLNYATVISGLVLAYCIGWFFGLLSKEKHQ